MTTPESQLTSQLTRKDFLSSIEPKWCVGCGCYSVLKAITSTFVGTGLPREKLAVISGIGCSSRFPYYVNTYGFHTLHGRAPTVALGLKLARPDLSVWVITGDGDALSIGGNHFMHTIRRNPDLKIVLFNNHIYGLTKGQASPTTALGTKTKSTPYGSVDAPVRPLALAIASGATFAARVTDADGEMFSEVLQAAAAHKGLAFVEVMLNCVIFNDGACAPITDKTTRDDHSVKLRHAEPLVFGSGRDKGIKVTALKPEIVNLSSHGDVYVHDVANPDPTAAYLLSMMSLPEMPIPLGIFRQVNAPVYEANFVSPIISLAAGAPGSPNELDAEFHKVLCGEDAWVEGAKHAARPLSHAAKPLSHAAKPLSKSGD